jgi:hypothetical protein
LGTPEFSSPAEISKVHFEGFELEGDLELTSEFLVSHFPEEVKHPIKFINKKYS